MKDRERNVNTEK